MTIYEINYRNRLNEMLNILTKTFGANDPKTKWFAELVNKHINYANYDNRNLLERYFKGYMKKA
jgi:hypothetical protein